jgi:hypothetical protein
MKPRKPYPISVPRSLAPIAVALILAVCVCTGSLVSFDVQAQSKHRRIEVVDPPNAALHSDGIMVTDIVAFGDAIMSVMGSRYSFMGTGIMVSDLNGY